MKTYVFKPLGVCSREIVVTLCDSTIERVEFIGGCSGNTQGISKLVVGMSVDSVISRLSGIDCKGRGTSCPDQLTIALREAVRETSGEVVSETVAQNLT